VGERFVEKGQTALDLLWVFNARWNVKVKKSENEKRDAMKGLGRN